MPVALRGVVQDITDRKHALQHIYRLAHFDTLTGLANRTLLARSLGEHVARARRMEQRLAVLQAAMTGYVADGALFRFSRIGDVRESFSVLDEFIPNLLAAVQPGNRPAVLGPDLAARV